MSTLPHSRIKPVVDLPPLGEHIKLAVAPAFSTFMRSIHTQVEKQRMNMTLKTQQSEEAKTEYANQLQKTNDMQTLHYHTAMPEVFQHLQVIVSISLQTRVP